MTVTVDREPLAANELGLSTVGQVLSHIQRENRLVVQVLIDGQEPLTAQSPQWRQTALAGHTLFIETADPKILALEVLDETATQVEDAEKLKSEATDFLSRNQSGKALEKLSGCLRAWQNAQESIVKVAELLRIDLETLRVGASPISSLLSDFSSQLRQIRSALEQRDYVLLSDVLQYEMESAGPQWLAALSAVRALVESLK